MESFYPHDNETAFSQFTTKIVHWCRRHYLPYVHGCIWDKHCREWLGARRVSLHWSHHMWWVDLPGHDNGLPAAGVPSRWQLLPTFGHHRSYARRV